MLRPRLKKVEPILPLKLRLSYENGEVKIFDVAPYTKGLWFAELKDETYSRTVKMLPGETGIEWRNGQDIALHELYDRSIPVLRNYVN